MDILLLDGREIAKEIKARCRSVRRTVKAACLESKVSYRTYRSWQSGQNNPSFALLKRLDAVIAGWEREPRG